MAFAGSDWHATAIVQDEGPPGLARLLGRPQVTQTGPRSHRRRSFSETVKQLQPLCQNAKFLRSAGLVSKFSQVSAAGEQRADLTQSVR